MLRTCSLNKPQAKGPSSKGTPLNSTKADDGFGQDIQEIFQYLEFMHTPSTGWSRQPVVQCPMLQHDVELRLEGLEV